MKAKALAKMIYDHANCDHAAEVVAENRCQSSSGFTCPMPNGYFAVEENHFCSNYYHCVLGFAVEMVAQTVAGLPMN